MPEDTESSSGIKSADAGGVPPGQVAPPAPPNANSGHQLTSFPVALVILLHYMTCGIFTLIWLNLMHGKLPRVRSDDPGAGKAIGFCFIPFFNLYWIFFTYRRLCLRVDEQRELYGLPPSNLRGMATTNCIFQIIPYINALIGFTIITPIYIGLMQSSVNQLVNKSANTAPLGTLPTQQKAASGMPGWAIALIVCGCMVPFIAIFAAMLLPALANAKGKAQFINSENNMKQIGLAIRIWENDNNDQYPWNVSQTNGGVMEVCETGSDGFEKNPAAVFMVMSNELNSPRILVSPNDPDKQAAADFQHLTANNITYELRTGPNVSDANPDEILAVDPINGIVLHCDGSVQRDLQYKK
jgi:Domain of unknown function (DUF4234)